VGECGHGVVIFAQQIYNMLSVAQAEKIIFENALHLPEETVGLEQALGRILRENITADRDFPPFDRVTMDGVAIRHAAFAAGRRHFAVRGIQAAGQAQQALSDPDACVEVMTGAMLPEGADAVIRYEDLHITAGVAAVMCERVDQGQNIHVRGSDRRSGDRLIQAGKKIGPAEIATAATVGKTRLLVSARPKTAIVSTGDELVDIAETPLAHQIRRSNVYAVQALLDGSLHPDSRIFHFPDDRASIAAGLEAIFAEFELVVLSGAVSEGKFDFLPEVLAALGVETLFHKVAQRPGKPFWFGRLPGKAVVFALPGNPVSTFLCARRYLLPFLQWSAGETLPAPETAVLTGSVHFKPALNFFLPVRTVSERGLLQAYPLAGQGSGDLANLNDADGFLELPSERDVFNAGEAFPFFRYRY
jgi:molybdopterin molybdotransferase